MVTTSRPSKANKPPDWWPLPAYRKPLDAVEWIGAITFRLAVATKWKNTQNRQDCIANFRSLIVQEQRSLHELGHTFIKEEGLGVRSLTIFEAHVLSLVNQATGNDQAMTEARSAADYCKGLPARRALWSEEYSNFRKDDQATVALLAVGERGFADVLSSWAPVAVDLRLDDDTLLESFELWLALNRSQSSPPHKSRSIGPAILTKWFKLQVLPAYDLWLWGDLTGEHYTDAMTGRLLWPDSASEALEFVDTGERFRKLTKPLVHKVFSWETMEQLSRQADAQKIFDNLLALRDDVVSGKENVKKSSGKPVRFKSTGRLLNPGDHSTKFKSR